MRPAEESDTEDVFEMLGEFAMSYPPQRSALDIWYPTIIDRQDNDLLVAELQGEVTGYVLATTTPTLFANGPITELLELFVKPAHRNLGIGRRLVQAVLENAKYAGAREVAVPTRRAADFYLKLGFQRTAEYLKRPLADVV